ncbi:MAG: hypothetical protein COA78_21250 [Blastopirellula sp.]|nr:MAG: hypothetical protein COA78_21250 [Blastopirellula sp.]
MFIEIPLGNKSNMRRLVFGVGLNDAEYIVKPIINGKQLCCPYYAKWKDMIVRCYSEKEQKRYPTYIGCTVCGEWLFFSKFKAWMINQDWQDKQLDKDLLVQGNKLYSPETCLFISSAINKLLINRKASRGIHSQGVDFNRRANQYRARVRVNGKSKHLGFFDTDNEAFNSYKVAKYEIIKDIALQQTEPLKSALLNYKISEY